MVKIDDVEFDDRCPECGENSLDKDTITKTFPRPDGNHMLVRELPVLRCDECGTYFIPKSSHDLLHELAQKEPDETVEIPAFTLKEAS